MMYRVVAVVALLLCIVFPAAAVEQPAQITGTVDESIAVRKQTQEKAGAWHNKKERLKSRYYQLKDAIAAGEVEVRHMQDVVDRQQQYIERMQSRMVEMEKMRQNLVPFLEDVVDRMRECVAADLPFLVEEREARVAALKQLIHDPELTMGEKIRRVFEGLRVEMDYGQSVETTKEEIVFNGAPIMVRVLRLGRTALLMQTLDEAQVGMYRGGEWSALPGKYAAEIKKAIEITERRRPIEFVNLPVRGAAR